MAKLSALLERLAGVEAKLDEGVGEVLTELQKLRDQLGDVDIPADAEATLGRIEAKVKTLADIVPNVPTPPA